MEAMPPWYGDLALRACHNRAANRRGWPRARPGQNLVDTANVRECGAGERPSARRFATGATAFRGDQVLSAPPAAQSHRLLRRSPRSGHRDSRLVPSAWRGPNPRGDGPTLEDWRARQYQALGCRLDAPTWSSLRGAGGDRWREPGLPLRGRRRVRPPAVVRRARVIRACLPRSTKGASRATRFSLHRAALGITPAQVSIAGCAQSGRGSFRKHRTWSRARDRPRPIRARAARSPRWSSFSPPRRKRPLEMIEVGGGDTDGTDFKRCGAARDWRAAGRRCSLCPRSGGGREIDSPIENAFRAALHGVSVCQGFQPGTTMKYATTFSRRDPRTCPRRTGRGTRAVPPPAIHTGTPRPAPLATNPRRTRARSPRQQVIVGTNIS